MFFRQRLIIFVSPHQFRNVVNVVARRIRIGVESVQRLVLWYFGD